MNPSNPETQDSEEALQRAREALRQYAATDPEIPVGGLPPRDYERWRRDLGDLTILPPQQQLERGWLELEYAMAIMRGGIDFETEEPYDRRKINAAFSESRGIFTAISHNESADPATRMYARLAMLSVTMHQEVVAGKPPSLMPQIHKSTPKAYLPYLRGLHAAAAELLSGPDPESYAQILHMISVMAPLTAQSFRQNWYLPAAPRQPWDVTIHSADRTGRPDLMIVIDGEPTHQQHMVIDSAALRPEGETDPLAVIKKFVEVGPEYTSPSRKSTWFEGISVYKLVPMINAHLDYLGELGVRPADEIIQEESRREPPAREIFDEVTWYLTEYSAQTVRGVLEAQVTALEQHRQNEGLRPDEQRILGWMQLELAQVVALDGDYDAAREGFAHAMDTFLRAQRMFMRERRPGDAHDAVLAQAAAEVHRALYTSREKSGALDRFALRRAIDRYIGEIAEIFASANKIKAEGDQLAVVTHTIDRATLVLLQAAANEELRHIILPNSPHTSDTQDAVALHILYDSKASSYDVARPIGIKLTDGSEIAAAPGTVSVGRNAFTVFGTAADLLHELIALVNPGKVKAAIGKGASKKKKGQSPAAVRARSEEVEELSEELAYAISDAYEAVG